MTLDNINQPFLLRQDMIYEKYFFLLKHDLLKHFDH